MPEGIGRHLDDHMQPPERSLIDGTFAALARRGQTQMERIESFTRAAQAWRHSRRATVPAILALASLGAASRGTDVDLAAASPEAALAETLTGRGLACEPGDVAWIGSSNRGPAGVTHSARALVRARTSAGEPSDLDLVVLRLSPEGAVLEVGEARDVTNTSGVDESRPVVRGEMAAYAAIADGVVTGVHVIDLHGRTLAHTDFTFLQRQQAAITNLQQTGQAAGIAHDAFALDPVAHRVSVVWRDDGMLEAHADDHLIVIDPHPDRLDEPHDTPVVSGQEFVRVVPDELARPGNLVTWAVDRVRAIPAFGDDRMQWVKAVSFTALDRWNATFSHGTTAKDVEDELGLAQPPAAAPTYVDPEVGWPPAPMHVPISPALPGEGKWIALDRDPFITPAAAGNPPAFVTSFVRPNTHRQDVRVYMTLWDPRQIALHMEAGTVEPISGNGEHGPGMVPRTPEVMKRFVAAFNGGFQAQHGEYGMQSNGIEYLPPKPYAATVMELRDGSNAFGAWPGPQGSTDSTPAPEDVIAFRQNLTAMVQDGRFNPWGRTWWGGTPPGWPDQIHSARSAICMTSEGFVGYFYSASISAEDLAQGMLDARCSFGIHLDMNPGHAGFEFYDVAPEGQLRPLGRPLQGDWEAEGKVPDMAPYVFRARRMIRGMGHMLFPRYIQREARDFFYLTARPILPGAPIPTEGGGAGGTGGAGAAGVGSAAGAEPDEGAWRTRGLPQHGFPYSLATAWVRSGVPAGPRLRVVRADPRTMRPTAMGASGPTEPPTVLGIVSDMRGPLSLWWSEGVFSVAASSPTPRATLLASGFPPSAPAAATARAAAGVEDEDGMLAWVELPDGAPASEDAAKAMDGVLARMGCSTRMVIPGSARALLGGSLDASGAPAAIPRPSAQMVRLVRERAPDAHAMFTETPIVPPPVWQPLQAKRVRYFYKPAPAASASASASSGPATSPVANANRVQSPQ